MEEANWIPKTEIGKKVQNKEIKNIDEILNQGKIILEEQIVDTLLETETDLLLVGQSKGKFGGGQRRVFRQTQKKTREGNKPRFTTMAIVGDRNGHIGIGYGKSKETVPAREKALRKAKLNVFTIRRGSGSWESQAAEPHSIPFAVEGKSGSVIIKLIPAPKGTGLCIEKECAKVLALAGIQDIWSRSYGQTKNKINLIQALEKALRQLIKTKVQSKQLETVYMLEGSEEKKVVIEAPEEGVISELPKEEVKTDKTDKKSTKKSVPKKESKAKLVPKKETKGTETKVSEPQKKLDDTKAKK